MKSAREIAAKGLALRMEAKIKIRQPLKELRFSAPGGSADGGKIYDLGREKELLELMKDELNVKSVVFDKNIKSETELDTEITPELKEEGMARELVRQIQNMRKDAGLVPSDIINIACQLTDAGLYEILKKWADYIKKETRAKGLESYKEGVKFDLEKEIDLGGGKIGVGIWRIKKDK